MSSPSRIMANCQETQRQRISIKSKRIVSNRNHRRVSTEPPVRSHGTASLQSAQSVEAIVVAKAQMACFRVRTASPSTSPSICCAYTHTNLLLRIKTAGSFAIKIKASKQRLSVLALHCPAQSHETAPNQPRSGPLCSYCKCEAQHQDCRIVHQASSPFPAK